MIRGNSGASFIEVILETGIILFLLLLALPVAQKLQEKGSPLGTVMVVILGGLAILRVAAFALDVYLDRRRYRQYLQDKRPI